MLVKRAQGRVVLEIMVLQWMWKRRRIIIWVMETRRGWSRTKKRDRSRTKRKTYRRTELTLPCFYCI